MRGGLARRHDWETPAWLFDQLHAEFEFTVDAASSHANAKLPRHWTVEEDGLSQEWGGERVFCNPPYGSAITAWVKAAWEHGRQGGLAVLVVPVRTESAWWDEYAIEASEIRFVRGRVHFLLGGKKGGGPGGSRPVFATAVLVFAGTGACVVSSFPTPGIEKLRASRVKGGA